MPHMFAAALPIPVSFKVGDTTYEETVEFFEAGPLYGPVDECERQARLGVVNGCVHLDGSAVFHDQLEGLDLNGALCVAYDEAKKRAFARAGINLHLPDRSILHRRTGR